jgi:cell division protein FtsQ
MAAGDSLRPGSGMRKLHDYGGAGSAVLDAEQAAPSRPRKAAFPSKDKDATRSPLRPHRDLMDDFADDADTEAFLRASGRNRRIRRGLIPRTRTGWIAFGITGTVCLLAVCAGAVATVRFATTSSRFRIQSSQQIEIDGNSHLSRAQMLSVFGEDVDRNIFRVPLDERRAQLEQMPWVDHATVMRLLPNRLRVHVEERVPVAFVRQGGAISLVDAAGVLLDIPPDAPGNPSYSFPVVTGIRAEDDAAARAVRMKLYAAFLKDLDSDGKGTSSQLSEVDLSDPEDVKALIPDHNAEVLVHFGQKDFLQRYHRFEEHIAEWRSQYPHLSGVDMRYERQVVLQMPPKDSTVTPGADTAMTPIAPVAVAARAAAAAMNPAITPRPAVHSVVVPTAPTNAPKPAVAKPTPAAVARTTPPAHHAEANRNTKAANDAATRKRVEAIRAWMAKREKIRAAAAKGQ